MKESESIMKKLIESPAGEILAIASLITATIVADKIADRLKEITSKKQPPLIDVIYKEEK